jgi:hypothetical protein
MPGLFNTRQRIDGARDSLDFVGVNYYTRAHLRFVPRRPFLEFRYTDPLRRGLTDIGWEDYPEGFARTLLSARRYGLPIWVTENGIDDRDGERRSGFSPRTGRRCSRHGPPGPTSGAISTGPARQPEWLEDGALPGSTTWTATLERRPTRPAVLRRTAETGS